MKQKGFAALLIIFILGMVSILVASGLILTGYNESQMARSGASGTSAFYAANSGIEEAIYKLTNDPSFVTSPYPINLQVGTGNASVSAVIVGNTATIDSTGTVGNFVKKIHAVVQNTSVTPGFPFAVHAGTGGFQIDNNSTVIGNVFSNMNIMTGSANNNCGNNASLITGVATASGVFTNFSNGKVTCVTGDAYAKKFDNCNIGGRAYYINTPVNCNNNPPKTQITTINPITFPISDGQIKQVTDYLKDTGIMDCDVGGKNDCSTLVNGVPTIGNQIINGSLNISSNRVNFSGPIWVKHTGSEAGDMTFAQNTTIGLTSNITKLSQIIVIDGHVNVSSNITFNPNGSAPNKAYLLPVSTYDPRVTNPSISDICTDPSINVQSTVNDILFFVPHGCLKIKGTGNGAYFGSAVAEKIYLGGSILTYDSGLNSAQFGLTQSGGWQISSFSQQ